MRCIALVPPAGWPAAQKKTPTEASRRIQILHIRDFVGVVLLHIPSEAAVSARCRLSARAYACAREKRFSGK